MTRQQVRGVLFDLLWRSFRYLSDCVCLQMQAVRQAIRPKLKPQERHLFAVWYEAQDWLAGLVPIVLSSSPNLLLPTLQKLEFATDADDTPWRCFLQAMMWRCEMVENRRRADSKWKKDRSCTSTFSDDFDWESIPSREAVRD